MIGQKLHPLQLFTILMKKFNVNLKVNKGAHEFLNFFQESPE